MSEQARKRVESSAISQIRQHAQSFQANDLSKALLSGSRSALAQCITLLEHIKLAAEILQICLPHSGQSHRIGITGVPGVGKSTFIDAFGNFLIDRGKKVAVLAIDPSSPISKGSILGDKTRMDKLASRPEAFIRPSPSAETLGGVARKTRETILLCEAAGFDVILVETVGVGQSETAVHQMTDFFLLLMLAGAGDQLQGIKRGIMEMCDAMMITKADGENLKHAGFARSEYSSALHLFPAKESGWIPQVEVISALENKGLDITWELIDKHTTWMKERGLFEKNRHQQDVDWMHNTIKESVLQRFYDSEKNRSTIAAVSEELKNGKITPFEAAKRVLDQSK